MCHQLRCPSVYQGLRSQVMSPGKKVPPPPQDFNSFAPESLNSAVHHLLQRRLTGTRLLVKWVHLLLLSSFRVGRTARAGRAGLAFTMLLRVQVCCLPAGSGFLPKLCTWYELGGCRAKFLACSASKKIFKCLGKTWGCNSPAKGACKVWGGYRTEAVIPGCLAQLQNIF